MVTMSLAADASKHWQVLLQPVSVAVANLYRCGQMSAAYHTSADVATASTHLWWDQTFTTNLQD